MTFQLHPGVVTNEFNGSTRIPGVGTTEVAFAGHFQWGPLDDVMQINDHVMLERRVGPPDANTYESFFTASNILDYARNLKLIRVGAVGMLNASANGSGVLIKNETDYQENHSNGANTNGMFAAKWPGDRGNSLKVSMFANNSNVLFATWQYNGYFDSTPNTSSYTAQRGGSYDEMHIAVIDEDGKFSGTANTVLERFAFVSKASDAINDDGSSLYYKDVLNDRSQYIWWLSHIDAGLGLANSNANWGSEAQGTAFGIANSAYTVSLSNGAIAKPADANTIVSFNKFKNKDDLDISLIATGNASTTVAEHVVQNIAEVRGDCIVLLSPRRSDVVNNIDNEQSSVVGFRGDISDSTYAFFDSGWKYQFDRYNNTYRWIPLNGDIAGIIVRSDEQTNAWTSPAGLNRGKVKNVTKLAWTPDDTNQDELYKNGINPVVTFRNEGPTLMGDKMMTVKPSSFDRINVRRLFIVLKKAISAAARYSLFEFNDEFTRSQFVSMVEPFLRDVKARRGIYDFRVKCDEINNTDEVIERNEFIGDIYIKPAKSINFIRLNFIAVRRNVAFDEIVGNYN